MEEHVARFITADTTPFRVFTSEILDVRMFLFSRDLLVYSADQKSGHEQHNDGKL